MTGDEPHSTRTIRVIIADDDESIRIWLRYLIDVTDGLELVGEACDAQAAVELARIAEPDVAVLDVRMPGGGGPEGATLIQMFSAETRIVAFSAYDLAPQILAMIEAGASGYVVKRGDGDEVIAAIRTVAGGGVYLASGVDTTVLNHVRDALVSGGQRMLQRSRTAALVEDVLDRGALSMVYQPIVELATGRIVGHEALARIDSPRRRPPNEWFEDAATVGRLAELEHLAVHKAVEGLDELDPAGFLAVNVAPETAAGPQLAAVLAGTPLDRIVLELTEHTAVTDYVQLSDALAPLRALGLRVAIDDVGAGYASMAHVLQLSPDIIKLDRALTAAIDTDKRRRSLVATMRAFAQQTDAALLAEGIETAPELETMTSLGVTLGQGYLLGHPVPLAEQALDRAYLP
ncbi:MAG: EAL domain-containing protein [Acidimicrobiales bacterium]